MIFSHGIENFRIVGFHLLSSVLNLLLNRFFLENNKGTLGLLSLPADSSKQTQQKNDSPFSSGSAVEEDGAEKFESGVREPFWP